MSGENIARAGSFKPLARLFSIIILQDEVFGITADDDVDGDLTSEIISSGEVNVNSAGVYILYYSVSDKAGNSTSERRDITVVAADSPLTTSNAVCAIFQ